MRNKFDISDNRRTVLALKSGDEEAFRAVYTAYGTPLRSYAAAILHDDEEAYEVVQDLFAAVWLNRRRLDESKPLRHYLLRAAHNNALRRLKHLRARRRREELSAAEHAREQHAPEEEPAYGRELLAPAIARLPEKSRRVLEMSYWENKKHAAIAAELSISVRTVETILYKVVRRLRREIKKN